MHLHLALDLCFVKKYSIQRSIGKSVDKYYNQGFARLNLKKNTKTMTSDWLYLYGALCWSCRSRRSTSVPLSASSSGALLWPFLMLMSAPLSINSRATSVELSCAAKCNGVTLVNRCCLFASAPSFSRSLTTSVRLDIVATWRAVQSRSSLASAGIPSRNIRSTVMMSPSIAASRNLSTNSSSVSRYEKRLDTI